MSKEFVTKSFFNLAVPGNASFDASSSAYLCQGSCCVEDLVSGVVQWAPRCSSNFRKRYLRCISFQSWISLQPQVEGNLSLVQMTLSKQLSSLQYIKIKKKTLPACIIIWVRRIRMHSSFENGVNGQAKQRSIL